ncbi:hypothetical protein GGP41_009202 [Bipolaris sorokiniana]|uniref:Uncharacterized protein n=1 Tax=Cochliobolus sativus TaxID=45130 RepID=A0A8H6DTK8_COCSA|nr:hypothetical protein GGP41_009202 [Bipolaris sorokiniana]
MWGSQPTASPSLPDGASMPASTGKERAGQAVQVSTGARGGMGPNAATTVYLVIVKYTYQYWPSVRQACTKYQATLFRC